MNDQLIIAQTKYNTYILLGNKKEWNTKKYYNKEPHKINYWTHHKNAVSYITLYPLGFLGNSNGKESAHNVGDLGLTTSLGRCLGREDPLEKGMETHSSISAWNSIDRGAWWATVHGVVRSWTRLSGFHLFFIYPYHKIFVRYTFSTIKNFSFFWKIYDSSFLIMRMI